MAPRYNEPAAPALDTEPELDSRLLALEARPVATAGGGSEISWSDIPDRPVLEAVATSGSYTDLTDTPTLGTAAATAATAYATAAQGEKADSAVQPAGIAGTARTIHATDATTWPEAADDGRPVIWVQTDPEGDPPPSGGRPGRAAGDLVFIAQTAG